MVKGMIELVFCFITKGAHPYNPKETTIFI